MKNRKTHAVRVVIANDHQLICDGLRSILAEAPEVEIVGVVDTTTAMIQLVGEQEPDVLLIDPFMHDQRMSKTLTWVHGEWPEMAIVALSVYDDAEHMRQAFQIGACTYLTIRAARKTIVQAVFSASRGEALLQRESLSALISTHNSHEHMKDDRATTCVQPAEQQLLTERELRVLQRVALGERNKEIAVFLSISEPTVKTHLANIYYKLGVDSRAAAVAVALERGIGVLPKMGIDVLRD